MNRSGSTPRRARLPHAAAPAMLSIAIASSTVALAADREPMPPPSGVVRSATHAGSPPREFDCAYRSPDDWLRELRAAVERGEIVDPAVRPLPEVVPGEPRPLGAARGGPLTPEDIFAYEDTGAVLLTDFSSGELLALMVDAANALMSVHGDDFDFIGYWLNFTPHHTIGTAFYHPIENDVLGIGNPNLSGPSPIFNNRLQEGIAGDNIEGFIMMWNINSSGWAPGSGPEAAFTRLALAQEFEHRFALYLPDLVDGRPLQGVTPGCGRIYHWNWRVDGQGSGMEISEWVGENPAILEGSFVTFNTDIPGGVFSYTDLYVMGYVSPGGMDAGNSELRYMNSSGCSPSYPGPISNFSSADIIAAAGPRIPDEATEDHDYRTGWVMFHRPGDPPSAAELDKAIAILEQHQIDWRHSTIGRGTMDNSLGATTAVRESAPGVEAVRQATLARPTPNPLAGRTVFGFTLSSRSPVVLAVHDVIGRRVTLLVDETRTAGPHAVEWDGRGEDGSRVAAGVYFVRLAVDGEVRGRRLVVVK